MIIFSKSNVQLVDKNIRIFQSTIISHVSLDDSPFMGLLVSKLLVHFGFAVPSKYRIL